MFPAWILVSIFLAISLFSVRIISKYLNSCTLSKLCWFELKEGLYKTLMHYFISLRAYILSSLLTRNFIFTDDTSNRLNSVLSSFSYSGISIRFYGFCIPSPCRQAYTLYIFFYYTLGCYQFFFYYSCRSTISASPVFFNLSLFAYLIKLDLWFRFQFIKNLHRYIIYNFLELFPCFIKPRAIIIVLLLCILLKDLKCIRFIDNIDLLC